MKPFITKILCMLDIHKWGDLEIHIKEGSPMISSGMKHCIHCKAAKVTWYEVPTKWIMWKAGAYKDDVDEKDAPAFEKKEGGE